MRVTKRQRITVWLCLVYAFFIGVAPAQGVVLCLEPDGSIAFESATKNSECDGCPTFPKEPPSASNTLKSSDECCPCIDLLISKPDHEKLTLAKRIELRFDVLYMPVPVFTSLFSAWVLNRSESLSANLPRSSHLLPLIRSIILQV